MTEWLAVCSHLLGGGYDVTEYHAYEIDKYAIKVANHNFPQIVQHGDVFDADYTQYQNIDWLIGGSPCTYWSIAQKGNRETTASGYGWELFSQYLRALKEIKPQYFLYENNKSMSKDIRKSIDDAFGFEAVYINSELVSAQHRARLYWVGEKQSDGSYKRADVVLPEDKGILLKDILQSHINGDVIRIPDYGNDRKARPINAHYSNNAGGFEYRIWSDNANKQQVDMIVDAVNTTMNGKTHTIKAQYYKNGVANFITNGGFAASAVIESWDGKTYPVYAVKNGLITIKEKEYPIALPDGNYIIRKLTISECKKLQTVPERYDMRVLSDTQAYKCLGNGWTVDIITHIINSVKK